MRRPQARLWLSLTAAAVVLLACNFVQRPFANWHATPSPLPSATVIGATPSPAPTRTANIQHSPSATPLAATASATQEASPTSSPTAGGARACAFVPGVSTPAVMPPEVLAAYTPTPIPSPTLPSTAAVDQATTDRQLKVYQQLWNTVNTEYVYRDFNGRDWKAIGAKYEALIKQGLTDKSFYSAMDDMVAELGDDHSHYDSPDDVRLAEQAFQGHNNYTGVGIAQAMVPEAGRASVIYVFPGSPAAEAGLRPHDNVVAANGQTIFDESGQRRDIVRGPEGTTVTLTIERPGDKTFDVTLTRRRITSAQPIDFCLVPGTRLAYLFLPSVDDTTLPGQVRSALQALMAGGPLDGLVLDNRQNSGGADTVLKEILGFFMAGTQGYFVAHQDESPLVIRAENIGNSQTMPMVVLVGPDTASFGEVMSGILQNAGRARLVGQRTMGIVEILWAYDFDDGSRVWLAHATFQPVNLPNGVWNKRGVAPDISVPTRWDLFTEATDPGLAVAVQLLEAGNR